MHNISLLVAPGGHSNERVDPSMSLGDFLRSKQLTQHNITIDGEAIPETEWDATPLGVISQIWATRAIKGA